MKLRIFLALTALCLLITACGMQEQTRSIPEDTAQKSVETGASREPAQIGNPWRDVTQEEAKALCPALFTVPEGAGNVNWSVMETEGSNPLVQLVFDLDGLRFTARAQETGANKSFSHGMYYEWTVEEPFTFSGTNISGSCYRYLSEEETADLMTWYDAESGVSYSLFTTAKSLDGFDLQAIAERIKP